MTENICVCFNDHRGMTENQEFSMMSDFGQNMAFFIPIKGKYLMTASVNQSDFYNSAFNLFFIVYLQCGLACLTSGVALDESADVSTGSLLLVKSPWLS